MSKTKKKGFTPWLGEVDTERRRHTGVPVVMCVDPVIIKRANFFNFCDLSNDLTSHIWWYADPL